jgi:peptidyl-prolyl cis-trans isomerase B (cyclophilin B)
MPSRLRSVALVPAAALALAFGLAGCGEGKDDPPAKTQGGPVPLGPPRTGEVAPIVGPEVGDVIAQADAFIAKKNISKQYADWRVRLPAPQKFAFPTDKKVHWTLVTNKGTMVAELWHDVAPLHVSSAVYLTRLGFYDGLTFHRVIKGFMAQGGDPRGDGNGWPGYAMPLELKPGVKHDARGVISTANASRPNTDGSQFFIMFRARSQLDGGYTIFGKVISGLETLDGLEAAGGVGERGLPTEHLVIEKATVELR